MNIRKNIKNLAILIVAGLLLNPVFAQDKPEDGKKDQVKTEVKKGEEQKPKEKSGKVDIDGQEINYIVQTGTIPVLKEDDTPRANVFYIYYARTGKDGKRVCAENAAKRPIMFCFNGGPGASAVWLHLGGLGPRRLNLPEDGLSSLQIAELVENSNSILDMTDLVFVDPVSTGLSRTAKNEKPENFYNVHEDVKACGEFIRLFVTREQRWASTKYLCGESYGVFRVAGLSEYLQTKYGLYLNGLVLVSGLINFQTICPDTENDLPYILFLPNMTATAYYHKKLSADLQKEDLGKLMDESRNFARNEYALALFKGRELPLDEKKKICETLSKFTGIPADEIEKRDMRLDTESFRKMLLQKEGKIIGRFDARVVAEEEQKDKDHPGFDPSFTNVSGAFSSAINAYVRGELGYESDQPYHTLVGLPWNWSGFEGKFVSATEQLEKAMEMNPKMKVLVLSGMRDLAVPEDSMRYSIAHMDIPSNLRSNISYKQYESGHMMYLYKPDMKKLREDILEFIKTTGN